MAEPLKLVHVTTIPLSLVSLIGDQAAAMRRRAFSVYGVSSPGDLLDRFAAEQGVEVFAVPMNRSISPLADLRSLWSLWCIFRRLRPHIVHSHTPKAGLLGTLAAWLARVPVRIYQLHGLRYTASRGPARWLLKQSERVACRLADRVLCISPSLRARILAESLCPPGKLAVPHQGGYGMDAHNLFNPAHFTPADRAAFRRAHAIPEDALLIGYAGRIVREKGLVELAEAWRAFRAERPDLHLLLAGPFEPHDPLPPETEQLYRSDPRVHLVGFTPLAGMPAVYAALDLLVLPSWREGFGRTLVEAAAMSVPAVATRIDGCVDAVQDGITGVLVPPHDASALAEAIRAYLSDPALRAEHGRAGRARVLRDFRPEVIDEAVWREYAALLSSRGLSAPAGASR